MPRGPKKYKALNSVDQQRTNYAGGALGAVCQKTKLCFFFEDGYCARGDTCSFAHGEDELRGVPDLTRTKMCPSLVKHGRCHKGSACKFAHAWDELRSAFEFVLLGDDAEALVEQWRTLGQLPQGAAALPLGAMVPSTTCPTDATHPTGTRSPTTQGSSSECFSDSTWPEHRPGTEMVRSEGDIDWRTSIGAVHEGQPEDGDNFAGGDDQLIVHKRSSRRCSTDPHPRRQAKYSTSPLLVRNTFLEIDDRSPLPRRARSTDGRFC